jgi:hypothetical protein
MRRHLLVWLLSISAVPAAMAQQRSGCMGLHGVPTDSLLAQARRLQPDVSKPENQSDAVIVALVYDNRCTIVRHAMKRVARQGNIEAILAAVFPDSTRLTHASFEISGFTSLGGSSKADLPLHPVVAWGVLTPRGLPR